ncbi:hypothetical protein WN55_10649 [Dufourea novaeangliae]|uniref:Uncharacterized protein n=1 Tax=Dufourea novaeangliae TaxID=178035 RepID=A0A154PB82_DUFNO|nr:hypothetical protein WN55_10649 [Dufourea novaeangliae]
MEIIQPVTKAARLESNCKENFSRHYEAERTQQNLQQKTVEANLEINTHLTPNINCKNTNFIDTQSYTQAINNSALLNEHNQYNNINEATEIEELLKQSIKNSEMLTIRIMGQNAIFRQQTQQITTMLQLLTNTLTHK